MHKFAFYLDWNLLADLVTVVGHKYHGINNSMVTLSMNKISLIKYRLLTVQDKVSTEFLNVLYKI